MSKHGLVTCVRLQTQPKIFQKTNLRTKNNFLVYGENTYHTISIYGKLLIIEFSYNFLYIWNCMKCAFCALSADSATRTLPLFFFCSLIFFDGSEKTLTCLKTCFWNIKTQKCAPIQCTDWPRNILFIFFCKLFINIYSRLLYQQLLSFRFLKVL